MWKQIESNFELLPLLLLIAVLAFTDHAHQLAARQSWAVQPIAAPDLILDAPRLILR